MNKIINLKKATDCEMYNPVLTLSEDLDYDNRFCVICTNIGNIAFSYYDLGVSPDFIIQNTTLFLCFGKGYYVLDLKEKCILCKADDAFSVIFEIVKFDIQSCIAFVGEMAVICFGVEGNLLWKNNYKNTILDWCITDEGLMVIFENDEKMLILLKDGNSIHIE